MKFVFIAVNYNGSLYTENYLQSLEQLTLPGGDVLEAVIVDNKSSDADLASVQNSVAKRQFARLIAQDYNPGYFPGLNAGIETCLKSEETILIVGNNDLEFEPDFLVRLKEIPFEEDMLVIAPNITTIDGRRQNPHVVNKVGALERIKNSIYFSNYYVAQTGRYCMDVLRYLIRTFQPEVARGNPIDSPGRMKIKRGIGACYILTPMFFHHYDRLDDRVFLWGEEALLTNQVESVGGCTLYDPLLKVKHCESASVRFIQNRDRYEILRASYKIYKKYL